MDYACVENRDLHHAVFFFTKKKGLEDEQCTY